MDSVRDISSTPFLLSNTVQNQTSSNVIPETDAIAGMLVLNRRETDLDGHHLVAPREHTQRVSRMVDARHEMEAALCLGQKI